jgi:hypothetical protein
MQVSYPSARSLRTLYMPGRVSQGAAVESCQLAFHQPPPIRYDASLCTTTRCSAQLPVPDRIYWLVSDSVGPGVCTMLYAGFRDPTSKTLGELELASLPACPSEAYRAYDKHGQDADKVSVAVGLAKPAP